MGIRITAINGGIEPMRMAIERRWLTVSCPSSVRNASMGHECLVHVDMLFIDQLSQCGNLANLLEEVDFILAVAVNGHASGIVSSVLETLKTWANCHVSAAGLLRIEEKGERAMCTIKQDLDDVCPVLFNEIIDIACNATVDRPVSIKFLSWINRWDMRTTS